jgi:hypothetical protein
MDKDELMLSVPLIIQDFRIAPKLTLFSEFGNETLAHEVPLWLSEKEKEEKGEEEVGNRWKFFS